MTWNHGCLDWTLSSALVPLCQRLQLRRALEHELHFSVTFSGKFCRRAALAGATPPVVKVSEQEDKRETKKEEDEFFRCDALAAALCYINLTGKERFC